MSGPSVRRATNKEFLRDTCGMGHLADAACVGEAPPGAFSLTRFGGACHTPRSRSDEESRRNAGEPNKPGNSITPPPEGNGAGMGRKHERRMDLR